MHGEKWSSATESRYQEEQRRTALHSYRLATLLAVVLFPAFSLLDWFTQREHFEVLSLIRYSTTGLFLVAYLCARRGWVLVNARFSGVLALSLAAASIVAMCVVMDGYASPYYAGVNLVLLAAGLLFHWGPDRMGLMTGWLVLFYLVAVVIRADFRIERPEVLINNLSFMVASALISTASAYLSDRLRRATFRQLIALESAHERIDRAIRILSREIRGEPVYSDDLDTLSEKVIAQKLELERAMRFTTVAKQEASHALQVRDEFISIASHELKTPLTVLKLQNDLLKMKLSRSDSIPTSDVRQVVLKSDAQIQRLARIVEDLLENSRMHAHQVSAGREAVDLGTLVVELIERLAPQLASAGIDARVRLDDRVVGLWDRAKLEQVISNLLMNAIKFAAGQPIAVRVSRNGDLARLEVSDQGHGIDPKFHRRIFERFERIDSRSSIGGLGLGLYIVRKIVEGHGGEVRVESEVGRGARFIVTLPASPENQVGFEPGPSH